MASPLPPVSPKHGNPPPSAPTALIFGIGQVQSAIKRGPQALRPATSDTPPPGALSPNPFAGYYSNNYGEGTTSVDVQLAALKEKRRLKALAFESPGASPTGLTLQPSRPQSGASVSMPPIQGTRPYVPRTPPRSNRSEESSPTETFPRNQYLDTQAPTEQMPTEYPSEETITPRKPVAVSTATLKRRLAMEEKAKAKEPNVVGGEKASALPPRKVRGKGASIPDRPQVATIPPPPTERLKHLEDIIMLLQAKGAQSAVLMENAAANEGKGKAKAPAGGDAGGPTSTVSFEWVCQEKGLQDLKAEFERWSRADKEEKLLALTRTHMTRGLRIATPKVSPSTSPAKRRPNPPAVPSAPGFFTANSLLKAYRDFVLCPQPPEEAPTKPQVCAPEGYILNSTGATMYPPTDKEIQYLLNNMSPIVRACLACSENGRSSVSKLAVEMMGLICDSLGVCRLHAYYCSQDLPLLNELMCSPPSRALDAHTDGLIAKLIVKGGTASVKFLYDVAATSLFQLLRGVNGSSNKVLIGVLLQTLGTNVPKTEKSRVLWGDALAFSFVQRWAMAFLYPALNASDRAPITSAQLIGTKPESLSRTAPTLSWILTAILMAPSQCELLETANKLAESGWQSAPPTLLVITNTPKDMKEILTRSLPVADILLSDGSPDVRESGKRMLLALVLLLEEFNAWNGYPSQSTPSTSPSKASPKGIPMNMYPGGLVRQLTSAGTSRSVRTPSTPGSRNAKEALNLETMISKSFMDAKAKLDRLRDAAQWARQAYQEGLAPLLLSFQPKGLPSQLLNQSADVAASESPQVHRRVSPHPEELIVTASPATPPAAAKPPRSNSRAMRFAAKRPNELATLQSNPMASLQLQLSSYVESSGPSSRAGPATPQTPLLAACPSEADVFALNMSTEQQSQVDAWCTEDALARPLATCIVALHGLTSKDRDREIALRYLLYCGNSTSSPYLLKYAVGIALLDGLVLKATSPNHRVQGMSLQLLAMLVCPPSDAPLAFSVGADCIDAICGKSIGCLTTAMASSSGIVSTAAKEILCSMLECVCGILAHDIEGGESFNAISTFQSLLYDLISTAFATRNVSARVALISAAYRSVIQRAGARLLLADVRFVIETCDKILVSEIEGLTETATSAALGTSFNASLSLTGTGASNRLRTPSTCALVCESALRLLADLNKNAETKIREFVGNAWSQLVTPSLKFILHPKPPAGPVDEYADDFEGSTEVDPTQVKTEVAVKQSINELISELSQRWGEKKQPPPVSERSLDDYLKSLLK